MPQDLPETRDEQAAPTHPIRTALLELLRDRETLTSTEAARELGYSSGLCSFHLRQLARYGYLEEATGGRGRVRPWRLRQGMADQVAAELARADAAAGGTVAAKAMDPDEFGSLARELEDEGYQRWLRHRDRAPDEWRHDEAFSAVLFLTPEELGEVADQVRAIYARYADREHDPAARPERARPVGAVSRLFPLLPADDTA
ncbi:winged helix-turn-helix domain-containing protein [Goodfellowiella coeruleoviolacea]|uniref:Helix-turn-helix domain-containing protein n=1 Tax=Goodfellowiella coeruleoviolacea TaxID=334858 RepID=A0AAE3KFU9_9PSEU|nr:helix-turn-helix domain-containing protein [Goodfellowiella coeruleoviolacea]MCP2165350.1 Helix-turn-helix domain-containing protein [Goodfellowiella coeruleoviolacea]